MERRCVLSIQSHVVFGYAGNKSATLPLQLHGFDVCPINSVQFSNHTQYSNFRGSVLTSAELCALIEGLRLNGILSRMSHVLTGYCGDESFLRHIAEVVKELKQLRPETLYVCDPVMGDYVDGKEKMYVPTSLLKVYQTTIVPVADVITPNQFEAEKLTESKVTDISSAFDVIDKLHSLGPRVVVLTSTELSESPESSLLTLASERLPSGDKKRFRIDYPRFDIPNIVGTGDVFSASFLASLHQYKMDVKASLERTIAIMQHVVHTTHKTMKTYSDSGEVPQERSITRELRLVDCVDLIKNPDMKFTAQELS